MKMYPQGLGPFVTAVRTDWSEELIGKVNGRYICRSGRKKQKHVFKGFMAGNLLL